MGVSMIKHALLTAAIVANTAAMAGPWQLKDPVDLVFDPEGPMPNWYQVWRYESAGVWAIGQTKGTAYLEYGTWAKPYRAAREIADRWHDGLPFNLCHVHLGLFCTHEPGQGNIGDPVWENALGPLPAALVADLMHKDLSDQLIVYIWNYALDDRWSYRSGFTVNWIQSEYAPCATWEPGLGPRIFEIELPVTQYEGASMLLDFGTFSYFEDGKSGAWQLTDAELDGVWDAENSFSGHCKEPKQGDTHQTCRMAIDGRLLDILANTYGPSPTVPSGKVFWRIVNTSGPKGEGAQPKDYREDAAFGCVRFLKGV